MLVLLISLIILEIKGKYLFYKRKIRSRKVQESKSSKVGEKAKALYKF